MKNFNTNTENEQTWLTPPSLIESLGEFDLDPCAHTHMPWSTAKYMNSLPTCGMSLDWSGKRVWLNPPYGRETFKWLDKLSESKKGIALIFARTETKGFHRTVWDKAHSVLFLEGRIKFHKPCGRQGNSANAPSCLVSYSAEDTKILEDIGLKGKLVFLDN